MRSARRPSPPPAAAALRGSYVIAFGTVLGLIVVIQAFATIRSQGRHLTAEESTYTAVAQMYRGWMWAALTPLVFYLRREFVRLTGSFMGRAALHVAAAVALLVAGNVLRIWASELTCGYWGWQYLTPGNAFRQLGPRTIIDFYLYWMVLGAGYVLDLTATKRQGELREEKLQTQLAVAELAALKQQVQPHFLFNSLNAISALMRSGESRRAQEALTLLASLLRTLLGTSGKTEIELHRELDYAESYLAIEKMRFEDRLVTTFDVEDECLEALVPTFILQPLIENAVKHGIARRVLPGKVRVSARTDGRDLELQVVNDTADQAERQATGESFGIGLKATRSRLEHLFGAAQHLDCQFDMNGAARVTITLPLKRQPVKSSR